MTLLIMSYQRYVMIGSCEEIMLACQYGVSFTRPASQLAMTWQLHHSTTKTVHKTAIRQRHIIHQCQSMNQHIHHRHDPRHFFLSVAGSRREQAYIFWSEMSTRSQAVAMGSPLYCTTAEYL